VIRCVYVCVCACVCVGVGVGVDVGVDVAVAVAVGVGVGVGVSVGVCVCVCVCGCITINRKRMGLSSLSQEVTKKATVNSKGIGQTGSTLKGLIDFCSESQVLAVLLENVPAFVANGVIQSEDEEISAIEQNGAALQRMFDSIGFDCHWFDMEPIGTLLYTCLCLPWWPLAKASCAGHPRISLR
jgi:hypothetical protein